MFGLPTQPTPYDLRFRLLGIPVRVHPLFWLIMALISGQGASLRGILIFASCAFVSIVVHEFGHGLTARALGYRPSEIVLYGMGGYCECQFERQTLRHRLAVLIGGPGAGFLLFGVVVAAGRLLLGVAPSDSLIISGITSPPLTNGAFLELGDIAQDVYESLLRINFWWSVFNLFPIWPLDGGRIAEVLLTMHDRRQGSRRAHILAIVVASGLAVYLYQRHQLANAALLAYLAFINFQMLQALQQASRYGTFEDEADWWKR